MAPAAPIAPLIADLAVQYGPRTFYLDIVVTAPLSYSVSRGGSLVEPGYFAALAESKKRGKYKRRYGESFLSSLIPFAIEWTGRLGTAASNFLNTFGRPNQQVRGPLSRGDARNFFDKRVVTLLAKAVSPIQKYARQAFTLVKE
jgi:hypothetical protein